MAAPSANTGLGVITFVSVRKPYSLGEITYVTVRYPRRSRRIVLIG